MKYGFCVGELEACSLGSWFGCLRLRLLAVRDGLSLWERLLIYVYDYYDMVKLR